MVDRKWQTMTDKQKVDFLQSVLGNIFGFEYFLDELKAQVIGWLEILENKPNKKQ